MEIPYVSSLPSLVNLFIDASVSFFTGKIAVVILSWNPTRSANVSESSKIVRSLVFYSTLGSTMMIHLWVCLCTTEVGSR